MLRASEETDYMYASVDLVSHRLTRLLRKYKDRKLGKRKVKKAFTACPAVVVRDRHTR